MRTAFQQAYPDQFYIKADVLLKGEIEPLKREEIQQAQKINPVILCGMLSEISIQYRRVCLLPFATPKRLPSKMPLRIGSNPTAIRRWLEDVITTTHGAGPGRRPVPLASISAGRHPRAAKKKGHGRVDNWQRIVLAIMKQRAGLNYREAAAIWTLVEARDPTCDADRDVLEAFRHVEKTDRKRQFPR